jgi:acetoin utilization deacetylase AcuC-like enzyme
MLHNKAMLPIVYHPDYSIVWPEDHRFPMTKFAILYNYLLEEGIAREEQIHRPEPASEKTLALVHEQTYLEAFFAGTLDPKAIRRVGMGWYPDLVKRTRLEVGGTVLATRLALQYGLACNTAGGTHHAFPDYGSGFCFLNDMAVAARLALQEGRAEKILIVDLDVHQGDGTAFIFRDEPRVFTLSLHCTKNFPFRKQPSDLDIGLPDGTDDEDYMKILTDTLPGLLDQVRPDLVLYDAGVDPHVHDKLGKLALSDFGLYRRDRYTIETCLDVGVPIACVIGGGYASVRSDLPPRHAILHRAAGDVWKARGL